MCVFANQPAYVQIPARMKKAVANSLATGFENSITACDAGSLIEPAQLLLTTSVSAATKSCQLPVDLAHHDIE